MRGPTVRTMDTRDLQAYIIKAMNNARGDDLERANLSFSYMTSAERMREHGQSGKTREQIWDEYKLARAKWQQAMNYLEGLFQ